MNKKLRFLSILLAMLMVLSSVAAVFAEGETAPQATDDGTQPVDTVTDDNGDPEDGTEPSEVVDPAVEPGTEIPEEDGTEPSEVVDPAVEPGTEIPEEGIQEESDAQEPALASTDANGEKVDIIIHCRYKADGKIGTKDFATVERKSTVGATEKAPVVSCATDPNVATFVVEEGVTEYKVFYKPTAPKKVTGFKLHPSYKAIVLTWNNVLGADKYKIYRSKDNKTFKLYKTVSDTTKKTQRFTDVNARGTVGDFSVARKYYYKVAAVNVAFGENYASAKTSSLGNTCVRPMYEEVTFKASAELTSHDGKSRTRTFRGGQTIIAQGFGGGKYKFWYKGNYFYASYVRVYNCKPKYQKNEDGIVGKAGHYSGKWAKQDYAQNGAKSYKGIKYYDKVSAESFVNRSGKSSGTKYLIWVSTYQQHLYIFKGSKGNWKLYKDWECSTGAAKSPTPTGFDKAIQEKWRNHSGIDYWSPFQHANSIHGQRSSYVFGKPQSNGCVRNFDQNAKWLYYNCGIGTGLIVH